MAIYKTYLKTHTQAAATDYFDINLGSFQQILTGVTFSCTSAKTDGVQLIMKNSSDAIGTNAVVIAGYTNSSALIQPNIFKIVTENQYVMLNLPFLYFESNTSMMSPAGDTLIYATTIELDNGQELLNKINTQTEIVAVNTMFVILPAPGAGAIKNVKSVYVYQSDVGANMCQLFINGYPVSQKVDLANNDTILMNPNSQIVLQPSQALSIKCDNAITNVYVVVTWTEINT